MKKILSFVLSILLVISVLVGCSSSNKTKLYVLNFGDYLAPELIKEFEKQYNCQIVQDLFEANEDAQPILQRPNSGYDLVCLSEYMIERLIKTADIFEEIDQSKLTNYKNLDSEVLNILSEIDIDNKYAIPYFKGDIGICYNKSALEEKNLPLPKKWVDLWNPIYKGELIMSNSIRDLFTAGAYKNGFSSNTEDKYEISKVFDDFIEQKPLVQGYFSDQAKEKLLSGEALIGLMLSGDMQYIYDNGGEDYYYLIPEGPKNVFIDAWCLLKSNTNKDLAYKFLDFILDEENIKTNCEYVGYESVYNTYKDEDYLTMISEERYIDNSTSVELERDLSLDAIQDYTSNFTRLKGTN